MVRVIIFDNTTYTMVLEKEYDRDTEIKLIKSEILLLYKKDTSFQLRKGDKVLCDSVTLKELDGDTQCFNFFSEVVLNHKTEKLKVLVDKKDIIFKDGKAYFRKENSFYKSFSLMFSKFHNAIKKELIIKFSLILLLMLMDNVEIAVLFISLSLLKFISKRRFSVTKKLEGVFKSVFKTIFLFFYTLFVISSDERILQM